MKCTRGSRRHRGASGCTCPARCSRARSRSGSAPRTCCVCRVTPRVIPTWSSKHWPPADRWSQPTSVGYPRSSIFTMDDWSCRAIRWRCETRWRKCSNDHGITPRWQRRGRAAGMMWHKLRWRCASLPVEADTEMDAIEPDRGMRGQNIICFAKEWNEDPTSCNHVLRAIARNNRVLWLNSISTRSPNLASGRDLRKIARRVFAVMKGATPVGDQMWLFKPFVLPFQHHRWAIRLNRHILRITLGLLRRRLGMRAFQLWTFVPTSCEYVGSLGEDMIIY